MMKVFVFALFVVLLGSTFLRQFTPLPPIPVAMFHYLREVDPGRDPMGYNLSLRPETFEKILRSLQEQGYQTVHLTDILARTLPARPIMLTFDDGYEDFYFTALPLLEKYGFTASAAIVTDMIGAPGHMTSSQIQDIRERGIEIFSHSKTHSNLIQTSSLNLEAAESKNIIEQLLGVPIRGFVYPSGFYDARVIGALERAQYKAAFTTMPGCADFNKNLFELRRIRIDNRDGLQGFQNKLSDCTESHSPLQ